MLKSKNIQDIHLTSRNFILCDHALERWSCGKYKLQGGQSSVFLVTPSHPKTIQCMGNHTVFLFFIPLLFVLSLISLSQKKNLVELLAIFFWRCIGLFFSFIGKYEQLLWKVSCDWRITSKSFRFHVCLLQLTAPKKRRLRPGACWVIQMRTSLCDYLSPR